MIADAKRGEREHGEQDHGAEYQENRDDEVPLALNEQSHVQSYEGFGAKYKHSRDTIERRTMNRVRPVKDDENLLIERCAFDTRQHTSA